MQISMPVGLEHLLKYEVYNHVGRSNFLHNINAFNQVNIQAKNSDSVYLLLPEIPNGA
jgi:hypothetical protein